LENGLQHSDDRPVRGVLAFGEPTQAVEVTEEFISAVDEVNDHFGSMLDTKYAAEQGVIEEHAIKLRLDQNAKEFADKGSEVYAKA